MALRRCTKTGCGSAAVATLTYVYADSTAVLGPLAPEHVPGSYHLCVQHCRDLSAPRGWEVIRLPGAGQPVALPADDDDLLALANAVREVGTLPEEVPLVAPQQQPVPDDEAQVVVLAQKRHLRMIGDVDGRR
ncbi:MULTISPECIES: DUF3499 family protein [unclassified Luteococcus]|uniref:DUF3499 family protein n=1 Tax=unclassified Luteococcus TaxID=2639923 RepID=UPI00313A8449